MKRRLGILVLSALVAGCSRTNYSRDVNGDGFPDFIRTQKGVHNIGKEKHYGYKVTLELSSPDGTYRKPEFITVDPCIRSVDFYPVKTPVTHADGRKDVATPSATASRYAASHACRRTFPF